MQRRSRDDGRDESADTTAGSEDELFRLHHQRLVVTIQRRLGISRDMAEDAAAFAWMQLVRTQPSHDNAFGWLYTVAKHQAFRLIRASASAELVDEMDCDFNAPPLARVLEGRRKLALLKRLKPQQRLVLRLRMEGLSYKEICGLTGQTYTWVNRHVTEGRRALRQLIEDPDEP